MSKRHKHKRSAIGPAAGRTAADKTAPKSPEPAALTTTLAPAASDSASSPPASATQKPVSRFPVEGPPTAAGAKTARSPASGQPANGISAVLESLPFPPLYLLLVMLPVAVGMELSHAAPAAIFVVSCLAIVPLAALMGEATEHLAERAGPGVGGLLNASFGNAAELIIALVAVRAEKYDLVKASLTGSIIGNILLVLGAAILAGGLRFTRQTFNAQAASMGATLLTLASIGLLVPTAFWLLTGKPSPGSESAHKLDLISEEIAVVLAGVYLLSLVFSLWTHSHLFAGADSDGSGEGEASHAGPPWSVAKAVAYLLAATTGVAVMSELLVGSVETAAHSMGMNELFVGVFVVAIVGNAAEHSSAVLVAMKDKMDLALNIAVSSSLQIALFVAPVLVFASMFMGNSRPLDLHFTELEVLAVLAAVITVGQVAQDGECHWMEGVMLLAVYAILGIAFFNLPDGFAGVADAAGTAGAATGH